MKQAEVLAVLERHGGWLTQRQIAELMWLPRRATDDKTLPGLYAKRRVERRPMPLGAASRWQWRAAVPLEAAESPASRRKAAEPW